MELQPGAYFKIGQEGFEYVGTQKTSDNPNDIQVVGRINPDEPTSSGALHRIFPLSVLEQEGTRVGPFNEDLPYSDFVAEKAAWQTRFSHDIDMPYPPHLLVDTLKRAKEAGITSLEYHFLPGVTMEEDGIIIDGHKHLFPDIPDWKASPYWFFQDTEPIYEALTFPSCHILVDNTQKPNYQDDNQMYGSDPFKKLIISLADKLLPHIEGSRFGISYDARAEHFDPALAQTLGLTQAVEKGKAKVTVPTELMFNVIGNMFHPEWGNTSTYEWFEDQFEVVNRLIGGDSGSGGLSSIDCELTRSPNGSVGFRPLIVFPQKPSTP